jgi:hypothetical protein
MSAAPFLFCCYFDPGTKKTRVFPGPFIKITDYRLQ